MHKILALTLLLITTVAVAAIQEKQAAWAFKFEDYAAGDVFKGKLARPVLTPGHRAFRTRIREGAAQGPNFAGHYTVVAWGCGGGCVTGVLVDASDGHIYRLPFGTLALDPSPAGRDFQGPVYQRTSRLLIADGCPNEDETRCGTYYYEWRDQKFQLLRVDEVTK